MTEKKAFQPFFCYFFWITQMKKANDNLKSFKMIMYKLIDTEKIL